MTKFCVAWRTRRTTANDVLIRCIFPFPFFGREPTTWPVNNYPHCPISFTEPAIPLCSGYELEYCLKRVQIIFCSCVIVTTLLCEKWQIASLSCPRGIKNEKQTWWSNDKTIIALDYCKISWFVCVSPSASANNCSSRHFSRLTHHDVLLNLIQ